MTVEEAAQAVEEHLAEEALRLAKLKKITAKLQAPAPKSPEQKPAAPTQQPPKTLSNQMDSPKPMSARERAILAFKGGKV